MNSGQIISFISQLGGILPPSALLLAQSYFHAMIKDRRIIAIYKDGALHAIMAFSLCSDYIPFWKKETWDYIPHQSNATTLYIELLAARYWDKEARETFQQEILKRYPQIEQAVWHKWADWGDRKVTWRRQWAMK